MKKRLIGRRIVGFEAGAFRDGELSPKQHQRHGRHERGPYEPPPSGGRITYNPVLILDDGTRVSFDTHETEIGEYGIDLAFYKVQP